MGMSRQKGVVTIEAAIILPIFIVSIISMIYFIKVIYIQDQIQSALTRTAHEVGTHAYLLDKIGLVDAQQQLYVTGRKSSQTLGEAVNNIKINAVELNQKMVDMTGFIAADKTTELSWPTISSKKDLLGLIEEVWVMMAVLPGEIKEINQYITGLLEHIKVLVEEGPSHGINIGKGELVELTNGAITSRVMTHTFKKYIPEKQLEAWHVLDNNGYIDFDDSNYMLVEDTVEVVARYRIGLPFINGVSIPIYQSVVARTFTGSYDYECTYKRKVPTRDHSDGKGEIYYTTKNGMSYHYFGCLRNEMTSDYYKNTKLGDVKCEICEGKHLFDGITGETIIYYTSRSANKLSRTIHIDHKCVGVYKKNIIAVTREEAEKMGKTPCRKYYCVGGN